MTKTFNKKLNGLFGGESSRQLGTIVFLEASRALHPALRKDRPGARLDITILNKQDNAGWEKCRRAFFAGVRPDPTLVALEQPIQ